MRWTILSALLFGLIVVSATHVHKDDQQDEESDPNEDELLDELETDHDPEDNDENDEESSDRGEYRDGASFSCAGKPGKKKDGTTIKYTDPAECHHWYECLGGVARRYKCFLSGQRFYEKLQYCRPGNCTKVIDDSCKGKRGMKHDGTTIKYALSDPTKCSTWFECRHGVYKEYKCFQRGYIFRPSLQYCVKGHCPSSDAAGFSCHGKRGTKSDGTTIKYTDPNNKHRWFECLHGVQKSYGCPQVGQVFREKIQYCTGGKTNKFCVGKSNGNYQVANDCSKFYMCSNGLTYVMSCPHGLYYNPKYDQCDYPKNVDQSKCTKGASFSCAGKPGKKPDGTTIKYTDPTDCHYWYECLGGVAKRYRCFIAGQRFYEKLQYCKKGSCDSFTCAGKNATKPDGTTIKYTDPADCHYWYECLGGVAKAYKCFIPGQRFYVSLQYCRKGSCDSVNGSSDDEQEYEDKDLEDLEKDASGFSCSGNPGTKSDGTTIKYTDPNNKHRWFECLHGVQKSYGCPQDGQVFKEKLQYCIGGNDNKFCVGKTNGNYQVTSDCSKFYICSNSLTHTQQCQHGLYYNPKNNQCDYPKNVDQSKCRSPAKDEQENKNEEDASAAGFSCSGKRGTKSDGTTIKYTDPNNKHRWFECLHGVQKSYGCPQDGQVFREKIQYCTGGNGNKFCVGKSNGNYQDASDCSKFNMCSNGLTHVQQCQHGLYYNSSNNQCDHPKNVDQSKCRPPKK